MEANDPYETNPAGRLWKFCRATVAGHSQGNKTLHNVWSKYFGIDDADAETYYKKIAAVIALPGEIRALVDALDDPVIPKKQLVRPLGTIEQAIVGNASGHVAASALNEHFNPGNLNDLETCSHLLAREPHASSIPKESLAEIREAAEGIIQTVLADPSIPQDLSALIVKYAQRLRSAVEDYLIQGPEAVVAAWDTLNGVLMRRPDIVRNRTVFDSFKRLAAVMTLTAGLVTSVQQISEFGANVLELFNGDGRDSYVIQEAPGLPAPAIDVDEGQV